MFHGHCGSAVYILRSLTLASTCMETKYTDNNYDNDKRDFFV